MLSSLSCTRLLESSHVPLLLAFLLVGCSGDENVLPESTGSTANDDGDDESTSDSDAPDDQNTNDDGADESTTGDDGDDDGTDDAMRSVKSDYDPDCEGYESKLKDCGVLSDGDFQCQDPGSPEEDCAFECLSIASCNILTANACTGLMPAPLERASPPR